MLEAQSVSMADFLLWAVACSGYADTLSARILEQEHRIYTEAVRIVLGGDYRIEGRRVLAGALTPARPVAES